MWKYLLVLLLSSQLSAQIIVTTFRTKSLVTTNVLKFTDISFPGIPYKQPKVYINYSPLHRNIAGITRELEHGIYIIDISPLYPKINQEKTLIHELIHVQQFFSNRLSRDVNGFQWGGKLYSYQTKYENRPWEVEAFAVSEFYCNENKYK